ncbi:MAG: site-specific integrase [Bacteroidetes bacterium]|nr:site-specific integrase [Bacteroidota bacterium]
MSRPTLSLYPNTPKQNPKTKKIPMYIRVTFKRQKCEARLPVETDQQSLVKWDTRTMRFSERSNRLNSYFSSLEARFNDFQVLHGFNLERFNAQQILDFVLDRRTRSTETVLAFAERYIDDVISPNPGLTEGTKVNYRKSFNHLRRFLVFDRQTKITLGDFGPSMAMRFKDYLISEIPSAQKHAMTEVSAAAIIKKLKPVFERAVWDELISRNPFDRIKLRNRSPKKPKLTIQQVRKIYELDLSLYPKLSISRDLFLFGVFTGLAYKDMQCLTMANILDSGQNELSIQINRQKTDVSTHLVLVSYARQLIDRYRKSGWSVKPFIFPNRSNQDLNRNLKFLAEKAEISVSITTHIARHTYRQLLGEAGITDYALVKTMMGQTLAHDIDSVYYTVTTEQLIKAKGQFQKFLNKHLKYD